MWQNENNRGERSGQRWLAEGRFVGNGNETTAAGSAASGIDRRHVEARGQHSGVMMMSQGWYISSGGHETGPFANEVVMEMIRVG